MPRTRTGWMWNGQREQAATLRSQGKPWAEVAAATGLAVKTVQKLVEIPDFNRRVQELTDAHVDAARTILKRTVERAATVVSELLEPHDFPSRDRAMADEVRLSAARDILNRLGVTAERDAPAPAVDLTIGFDVTVIDAAEAAFIAALRAQSAALGESLYPAEPPDSRHGALPALPVPGGAAARSPSGALDSEGAPDGDEPGGRA